MEAGGLRERDWKISSVGTAAGGAKFDIYGGRCDDEDSTRSQVMKMMNALRRPQEKQRLRGRIELKDVTSPAPAAHRAVEGETAVRLTIRFLPKQRPVPGIDYSSA